MPDDEEIPTVEYGSAEEEQTPIHDVEEVEYQKYKRSNTEKAKNVVEGAAATVGSVESKAVSFLKQKKAEYDAGAPERARKAAERKAQQQAQAKANPQGSQRPSALAGFLTPSAPQQQAQRSPRYARQAAPVQQQRPGLSFAPSNPSPQMSFAPSRAGPTLSFAPSNAGPTGLSFFPSAQQRQYPRTTKVRVTKAMRREIRAAQQRQQVQRPGLSFGPSGGINGLSLMPGANRRPQQASFTLSLFNQQPRMPSRKAQRRKR